MPVTRLTESTSVTVEARRRDLLTDVEVEPIFEAIVENDDMCIGDMLVRSVRDAWRQHS